MAAFSQEPDEGYSEDPLNASFSGANDVLSMSAATSPVRLPSEMAAWLTRNIPGLPNAAKTELAMAILDHLPTSAVVQIVQRLRPRLYIDFIHYLPPEICLKVLSYLDPVSLINVAMACHAWYVMALDRQLWEKLYRLEGWKAVYSEVTFWENKVNERLKTSPNTLHRIRSSEDGHTNKKRAISEDNDLEMTDVDRLPLRTEDSVASVAGSSIFGSQASSFTAFGRSSATPQPGETDSDWSASASKSRSGDRSLAFDAKGKGKASTPPPLLKATLIKEESLPPMIPIEPRSGLSQSSLWSWDAPSSRYKLNWKYLYTMRRRLERNWELGKFSNFQLPHPDHLEEGHRECIYTLQYDSDYLVSGSRDCTLRIWSMHSRRLMRKPLVGHNGSVLCVQFDADPEEDLVVSGSSDSDVILWRFSTGQIIQRLTNAHSESVLNLKFDKRILVTCSKDKSIKIFNRRPLKYGDPGYSDTEMLYSAPTHLRNYGYFNPMDELPVKPPYTMIGVLDGHGAAVNAVQICNNEVVSASGDRNIKVWDWAKQVCIRTVVGHTKGIACVQYDGRRIVSGSSDNEVKVFDRFTGLEVASLRAHANLVRTVQAGFGDLPYSAEEDKLQAKKIDAEYFKAIEQGLVSPFNEQTSRRTRPRNAGSSRPEDITAYGACLPPGGGGGKYARIVSGSYDQTIIVWRRNKDGVWKPAHHLRQEEAATAAQNQAQAAARHAAAQAAVQAVMAQTSQAVPGSGTGAGSGSSPQAISTRATDGSFSTPRTTIETPIIATLTPDSARAFKALIDTTVPKGPAQLRQALASYPTMLAYETHIQAAIAREPDMRTRGDLLEVLRTALLETQISQSRTRLAAILESTDTPTPPPPSMPSYSAQAGPSSSQNSPPPQQQQQQHQHQHHHHHQQQQQQAPPPPPLIASTTDTSAANPRSRQRHNLQTTPANNELMRATILQQINNAAGLTQRGSTPHVQGYLHIQGQPPAQNQPEGHGQGQQAHALPTQPGAPVQTLATPVPGQGAQHAVPDGAHHPHMAHGDNGPARVFKLQYDARRIICCSQTSVIVGWDFCNNDPELEEVARFFGPVE